MTKDQINQVLQKVLQTNSDAAAALAKERTYPMADQDLKEEWVALDTLSYAIRSELYHGVVDEAIAQASTLVATVTHDLDRARPFLKQTAWRTTPMYKYWELEPIEAAYGDNLAITRSRYGYRVMATPHMQSLDADSSMAYCVDAQRKQALEDLEAWIEKHPGQIWKVYETAKGLRFIRIDSAAAPDEQYIEMATAITNADSRYAELCVEQGAYRLRVSAKPWRIGSTYPGWSLYDGHFDRSDPENDKLDIAQKNVEYDKLAAGYRVAHLAADWKMNEIFYAPPALKEALQLHDTLTGADYLIAESNYLKDEEWTSLEVDHGEPTDIICHDTSLPSFVAFNHVYRSTACAHHLSGIVWAMTFLSHCGSWKAKRWKNTHGRNGMPSGNSARNGVAPISRRSMPPLKPGKVNRLRRTTILRTAISFLTLTFTSRSNIRPQNSTRHLRQSMTLARTISQSWRTAITNKPRGGC